VEHWAKRLLLLTVAIGWACYVVLPMAEVQRSLPALTAKQYTAYVRLLLFGLGTIAVGLYFLSRLAEPRIVPSDRRLGPCQGLAGLRCFLSALIFFRVLMLVPGPLDRDEKNVAMRFPSSHLTDVINPFASPRLFLPSINQTISITTSFLSSRLFGLNEFSLRLPSLFFCLLFLVALNGISKTFLGGLSTVVVYGHLASNQLILWYMASSKGYMALMAFSLLLFGLVWKAWENEASLKGRDYFLMFLCFLATTLSHTFGALFCFLLWLSWLAATVSSKEVSGPRRRIIVGGLCLVPFLGVLVLNHALFLDDYGDLFRGQLPNLWHAFSTYFGFVHAFYLRILISLILLLTFVQFTEYRRQRPLNAYFFVVVFLFFAILLPLLETRVIKARYFLAFLVPLSFVLGELSELVTRRQARYATQGVILFLLVGAPLLSGNQLLHMLADEHRPFEQIARFARAQQKLHPDACWSFSGDRRQILWMQSIYLNASEQLECRHRYHLFFGADVFDHPIEMAPPPFAGAREIYRDTSGRVLFEITS
jgi:hypothetical protein